MQAGGGRRDKLWFPSNSECIGGWEAQGKGSIQNSGGGNRAREAAQVERVCLSHMKPGDLSTALWKPGAWS